MISSEVQRTLVKSLPELWAELSDPAALARHLGELGEIRITRTEPEKAVEWEAEDTTGTVRMKPSGWGTRVTLTVTREIPEPEMSEPEAPEPASSFEPLIPEPQPVALTDESPEPELEPTAMIDEPTETEPEIEREAGIEPRRGFFARLFRRRRKEEAVETTPIELDAVELHTPADTQDEDASGVHDEAAPDITAELRAAEEVAAEQVTAVLTGVLDRLGAAHHRPFSRS